MFDVHGDEIVLDGITIGRLTGGWPTLQQRAVDGLCGIIEGYVSEDDHEKALRAAEKESFEEGKIIGADEAEPAIREEIEDEAFERGRQSAFLECERAGEAERIALLIASCNKAYAHLQQGLAKRTSSAIAKEMQSHMRACLLELQDAARRYKA